MTPIPKVSIYITNHNYGRFIERAIDSVLAQSLDDYELIIIDDGSTDNSRDIIDRYVGHPRVTPIYQHNRGLNVTNNIAMRTARGTYIMRLDADDWLDENALDLMAGALDRDPELGLVFPDYYMVDEAGHVLEMVRRHDFDDVTLMDQPAHGACTMIRRKCLMDLGGYDETLRCQDGYDLWIRFIEHYKVKNLSLPLFYYRQHGSSLTRNERRILDTRAKIIERHSNRKGTAPKTVAIIPVRGRKLDPASPAMELLGDKPLIDWTIEAALAARHIEAVVVTSPDQAILDHVRGKGIDRLMAMERKSSMALPNTTLEDSLIDAIERYAHGGEAPEAAVILQVEAPFRTATQIDTAIEVMVLFDTDLVVGVRPENDLFYRHDGNGLAPVRKSAELRLEREELYREVGGLKVVSLAFLRQNRGLSGGRVGHVVLDQKAAHYIKSDWDWAMAGLIAGQERG
jgi:CMP-N-acetylneuraminic acid synthetase